MNQLPIYDSVQQLIGAGDTAQALQVLRNYLEKAGTFPEYLRMLRLISANFNSVRQQELKGILDFSEARIQYAKSNDALLQILEDLNAGKKPEIQGSDGIRSTRLRWWIGGAVLALVGLLAGLYFAGVGGPEENKDCPKFRIGNTKVLVLEFQKLSGDDSKPELGLQTRIRDLTSRNNMQTDVRILPAQVFAGATPSLVEATDLGKQCQADMVIWGQYEGVRDSIAVDIRYTFTASSWPPGAAMQTFRNISEIKADQMKITNLDEAVFRLCTALALHENKLDLADKWLNKLQNPNARELQWKKILKK